MTSQTVATDATIGSLAESPPATHALEYRRDIDGLRAVAVLSVIFFHAAPGRMPGGFIGVDVFFVISGYLISTIILREMHEGEFTFVNFYVRRVLRIFPPLLLVMSTTLICGSMLLPAEEYRALGKHIAGGAGFVSNFTLWAESGYFDSKADFKPLLHLWSLGVEEQFYIIWPVLLFACYSRASRLFGLLCVVGALSFGASVFEASASPVAAFYSPLTRFWELLAGCVTALTARSPDRRLANFASVTGTLLLVVALAVIDKQKAFPGFWALLPTAGAALLIWAGPGAMVNRLLLSNRALVAVGLISYSLYLWHWPLLSFLRIAAGGEVSQTLRAGAVGTAVVLSVLSYRFVERPIRAKRDNPLAPVSLTLLMGLLGAAGLAVYATNASSWRPLQPAVVNAGEIGHEQFFETIKRTSYPCMPLEIRAISDTWNGITRCFQSKPQADHDIAIIGDSHGEHLFPGLAHEFAGENVVFYGMDGLPLITNKEFTTVFSYVTASRTISDVFIAAAWNRKLRDANTAQWATELQATVDKLVAARKHVYLVEDVHSFSFAPNVCKYAGRAWIRNRCSETVPEAAYVRVFDEIAGRTKGVRVVSPNASFCAAGTCSMAQGGKLLYRDEHHLNIEGSAAAAAAIARQIRETHR